MCKGLFVEFFAIAVYEVLWTVECCWCTPSVLVWLFPFPGCRWHQLVRPHSWDLYWHNRCYFKHGWWRNWCVGKHVQYLRSLHFFPIMGSITMDKTLHQGIFISKREMSQMEETKYPVLNKFTTITFETNDSNRSKLQVVTDYLKDAENNTSLS